MNQVDEQKAPAGQDGDITKMLRDWGSGNSVDSDHLFQLVYPQLRGLAASLMQTERRGHLLQPTGVVNELFLKLVQQRKLEFANRQHFYSFSARLMRRILVDFARGQGRAKRDGGQLIPLTEDLLWADTSPESILDVDNALSALEALDERKCRMVEMRFVLGFTAEETADLMGLSKASVDRDLRFARSWLQNRLAPSAPDPGDNVRHSSGASRQSH